MMSCLKSVFKIACIIYSWHCIFCCWNIWGFFNDSPSVIHFSFFMTALWYIFVFFQQQLFDTFLFVYNNSLINFCDFNDSSMIRFCFFISALWYISQAPVRSHLRLHSSHPWQFQIPQQRKASCSIVLSQ